MILVEHPLMTIGELFEHIKSQKEPIRRSTHIGNQPAHELAIMCALPNGIDVLMVDTIHGHDSYAMPRIIINGNDNNIELVSRTQAEKRVVGSINAIDPNDGLSKSLIDIHNQILYKLPLSNPPMTMMSFFSAYPNLLKSVIEVCQEVGVLSRYVDEAGCIRTLNNHEYDTDIYGFNGAQSGVLLPLVGMMAMEILISLMKGSNSTLHLGSRDMVNYTKNFALMQKVEQIYLRVLALNEITNITPHYYRILDCRGLGIATIAKSQHELWSHNMQINFTNYTSMTGLAA